MEDFKVKTQKISLKDFLSLKQVIPDIKSLPHKFIYFMIFVCCVIIFFNFFDVQGSSAGHEWFLPLSTYHSVLNGEANTFGNTESAAVATAVLYALNGLASFTGIIAVVMIAFDKSTQYFWGVIDAIFFGLFAISSGYLGDLIMQAIIILCCPLGWYLFEKALRNPNHNQKKSWKFNLMFFIGTIICIAITTLVLYEFLPNAFRDTFGKLKGAVNPYTDIKGHTAQRVLDSLGNGMNFVGYIMQLTNLDEQMYLWLFNDTIKLLKFTNIVPGTLSINMLIQFVIWLSLDTVGIYNRLFKDFFDNLWNYIKSWFNRK